MQRVSIALVLLVALVNLAPVLGVLSAERLQALYGIPIAGPDLEILMRHRALLFAVVGALLVAAAFHPPLRGVAVAAGLFSMLSFAALAWGVGGANEALRRVAWIDVVASLLLVAAFALDLASAESPSP